jgi:hypothetical protein
VFSPHWIPCWIRTGAPRGKSVLVCVCATIATKGGSSPRRCSLDDDLWCFLSVLILALGAEQAPGTWGSRRTLWGSGRPGPLGIGAPSAPSGAWGAQQTLELMVSGGGSGDGEVERQGRRRQRSSRAATAAVFKAVRREPSAQRDEEMRATPPCPPGEHAHATLATGIR